MRLTANQRKLLANAKTDKLAADIRKRMSVSGLPSESQLANVHQIIDLLAELRQRQPTQNSRKVISLFDCSEELSNIALKGLQAEGKAPILLVLQLVLWHIAIARDSSLQRKPACQALFAFCSHPKTAKRTRQRPRDPQIAAAIRRFFTPTPEWWTPEFDHIIDGTRSPDTRYARQPGGYRHTDAGWASYDATCRAAEAANPGFMDRFREHHEQANVAAREELAKRMPDAAKQTAEIVQNRPEVCTAVEK